MRGDDSEDDQFNLAACKGAPFVLWYPDFVDDSGEEFYDDGTVWEQYGDTSWAYEDGREVCALCPIKDRCLDYAMLNKERYGMWGGLTPIERRRIERRDRRKRLQERRRQEALNDVNRPAETPVTLDEE